MVPPRPAVIAHGKVLRVVYELRVGTPHSQREARPSFLARPGGAAFALCRVACRCLSVASERERDTNAPLGDI